MTFGGSAPVARIAPGTILELWTEDCFASRVRGPDDLVPAVCEFPYLNPQTGPRLESDRHVMSTESARPLEDALRVVKLDLLQWVSGHSDLSLLDAYQFLSQAVEAPLANVADTN